MQVKLKFLKSNDDTPHSANSHSQEYVSKRYSRKKIISPVSSEVAVRKEMQSNTYDAPRVTIKTQKQLLTVNSAESDNNEKLIALSLNLNEKLVRRRRLFALMAKVVLWGIIFYVLVLSVLPAVEMIFSRWRF